MAFDATFWAFVGLVLFLALLVVMKVPGMIGAALDKRAASIREDIDNARKLREEAERLLADYQRRATEAKTEAASIVEAAKREAAALSAEAKARIEDYVARRTRMAEDKIAQAEAQAIQEVRALSADVAVAAAETILAARTKGAEADRLIDASIASLATKLN